MNLLLLKNACHGILPPSGQTWQIVSSVRMIFPFDFPFITLEWKQPNKQLHHKNIRKLMKQYFFEASKGKSSS
jgi:hypothetical protein